MKPRLCGIGAVLLVMVCSLQADPPVLSGPVWSNGQFRFTLTGQSETGHVIEVSGNLRYWMPLWTNSDLSPRRAITVEAPGRWGFYRVRRMLMPVFRHALVSIGSLDLCGNNLTVDSFDSSDPNYSTYGQYDPAKPKDTALVAASTGLTNSLAVGNANIWGKLVTGPGRSVDIGPDGSVGDLQWHADCKTGIQSGHVNDDMNMDFPPVELPTGLVLYTPGSRIYSNTFYMYGLDSGAYKLPSLAMSGSQAIIVTSNAILIVYGPVSISGQAFIQIAPGASLTMYIRGPTADLGGNGIINQTSNATSFAYYGLPSNTSLKISGAPAFFCGTIYAPSADCCIRGGGDSSYEIIGACVVKSITLSNQCAFHYDESLRRVGPLR